MSSAAHPARPSVHHRVSTRGPALQALRGLHRLGWSDRQIAEVLADLSATAVAELARTGFSADRVEGARVEGAGGLPWTRRQVGYYRRSLQLPANRQQHEGGSLLALRASVLRCRQVAAGWGHLLPVYDEQRCCWGPGHELSGRQVEVLCLLRDRGPLTRLQLAGALVELDRASGRSGTGTLVTPRAGTGALASLLSAGLVESIRVDGASRLSLTAAALAPPREPRLRTGVERLLGVLALESRERSGPHVYSTGTVAFPEPKDLPGSWAPE